VSALELIFAVLSLLVAIVGLIWQVIAPGFRGWVPGITAILVERAVRKLPPAQREARREEWIAELSQLPRRAIVTQLEWAWDFGRAARNLNATESDRPNSTLNFKTRSARQLKSHRVDLRLQSWLSGNRAGVDQLLSYLTCLVIYEWNESSSIQTARAMGCSGNVVYAGIARLERALEESLIHEDEHKKLTPLGEDIAVAARPLISSLGAPRSASVADNVIARYAINSVVTGYLGEALSAPPLPEPALALGMVEQQLQLFDPRWMPAPRSSSTLEGTRARRL
jgi:hypothetical protein